MLVSLSAALIFTSCGKKDPGPNPGINYPPSPQTPTAPATPCDISNRPVINATLIPVGTLSIGRIGITSATAGNKIMFAGGQTPYFPYYSAIVDNYDFVDHTWSSYVLSADPNISTGSRTGAAIAATGSKIFFAGGGNPFYECCMSRVDIYDASTNTWSTSGLSVPRMGIAAASAGDKILFAGGTYVDTYLSGFDPDTYWYWFYSNVVDIYDNTTNTWTTATLSEGRTEISATTAGNKIYFAGGRTGSYISKTIDIYDALTGTWSTSRMEEPKLGMASIAVDDKIFWAGGSNVFSISVVANNSNLVEIRDLTTGVSSFTCLHPSRTNLKAVKKDSNIIFFTGAFNNDSFSGTHFDIYNTITGQWSTGELSKWINDATIISVNNTIYVAGGRDKQNGPYFNEVWKLEF